MKTKGLDDIQQRILDLLHFHYLNGGQSDKPLLITPGQLARQVFAATKDEVNRVATGDVLQDLVEARFIRNFSVVEVSDEDVGEEDAKIAFSITIESSSG